MQFIILSVIFLAITILSANIFVGQSIALAKKLKISSFLVGFTLVALGTSLPEFVVSTYSTYVGHTDIAISNILGSCIANVTLVLGIMALFKPYKLSKEDVFFNVPISLIAFLFFAGIVVINGYVLNWVSGLVLLISIPVIFYFFRRENKDHGIKSNTKFNAVHLVLAFVGLGVFGKLAVDNVLDVASFFSIDESILGYFVVAIGTSLLELIAGIVAARKGDIGMSIGNILGSNIINIFLILGTSSLLGTLDFGDFRLDIFFVMVSTVALTALAIIGKKYYFTRIEGVLLLLFYAAFVYSQFM